MCHVIHFIFKVTTITTFLSKLKQFDLKTTFLLMRE